MLPKQFKKSFIILAVFFILTACSSSLGSSTSSQNNVLSNNGNERTIITFKNMESVFKDDNRKLFCIKKFYLELRDKNTEKITDCLSNDVVFSITGKTGTVPIAGTYSGKEAVKGYLNAWYSSFSEILMTFQFNLEDGDIINTHVQMIAKIPSLSRTLNAEFVYSWVLNDEGKIKNLFLYYDTYTWWKAFQPGGADYIEDFQGSMNFDIHPVNYDVLQFGKDIYAAYNTGAGSLPTLLSFMDNNLDFILKGPSSCVYPGKYHGIDGFIQFLTNLSSTIHYAQPLYNEYFVVQGNRFDYHGIETVVCNATGKVWSGPVNHSMIVTDDRKIIEFKSYNDSFGMYEAFQP